MQKDIIRLNNENNLLKNENQSLKNENLNLKNEISVKNVDLNKYMLKINELNNTLTNKNNEISNLNNRMKDLNNKMNNLKLNNNQENEFIRRGELLIIQIKSIDGKVDIPYSCKSSDIFVDIEKMLYNEYPEYKDLNTYFTVNGVVVKRFRNLLENNIRNKDKILLNIYE